MNIQRLILASALFMTVTGNVLAEDAVDAWKRSISAGYSTSSGNTEKSEFSASAEAKKTTGDDEIRITGNIYNSRSNSGTDGQKWDGLARYSYNFGEEKMWFESGQLTANHDKFANIDYRITPALGLGRWISKNDDDNDWNAYVEGLVGYEMTEYVNGGNDEQPVAIAHAYAEKNIFERGKISEDLAVTPSLEENRVKIKSETAFTNALNDKLSLDSRFVYEYDSEPPAGAEDTDTRWITGVKYNF